MPNNTGEKRPRGRPRAGDAGGRVRDAPALLVRPSNAVYEIVTAVAEVKKWSRTRVITDAIATYYAFYLRQHDARTAREVEQLLTVRRQAAERAKHNETVKE